MSNRKYLICSFSGGRTSALMTLIVRLFWESRYEKTIYLFANTGEEDERTLEFADRFSRKFDIPLVWLEADTSPIPGIGTKHKVVTFETAARANAVNGPFEKVIAKYGIPNSARPLCSKELKRHPILSYAKSLGWKRREIDMAIGIRVDEIDRISENADRDGIVYPLIRPKIRKEHVKSFWRTYYPDVDLDLPEHLGNCRFCWKKSFRKLYTICREQPDAFDFAKRMEEKYKFVGKEKLKGPDGLGMRFFRKNKWVSDLFDESKQDFKVFTDPWHLDQANGCEESCEVDFK